MDEGTTSGSISTQSCRSLHWIECKDRQLWVEIASGYVNKWPMILSLTRFENGLLWRLVIQ